MSLDDLSLFRLASQRLQWLGARQQVISQNIANADSPGYRSRDLASFEETVQATRAAGLAVTDPRHIRGGGAAGGFRAAEDEGGWETRMDGNNVVLEEQTIRATETAQDYRLAAELYRNGHELLTLAATGR